MLQSFYTGHVVFRDHEMSVLGYVLFPQATTLRERVFARLISTLDQSLIGFKHNSLRAEIHPSQPTLQGLMLSCLHVGAIRDVLKDIPFRKKATSTLANDELFPWLQDLANIVADETTQAYTADYFPGLPDVNVPDEHVMRVMEAMQRELYREGDGGHRGHAVQLVELPFERQRALAERRRHWFEVFGITPLTWDTGVFDLLNVQEISMPELRRMG